MDRFQNHERPMPSAAEVYRSWIRERVFSSPIVQDTNHSTCGRRVLNPRIRCLYDFDPANSVSEAKFYLSVSRILVANKTRSHRFPKTSNKGDIDISFNSNTPTWKIQKKSFRLNRKRSMLYERNSDIIRSS